MTLFALYDKLKQDANSQENSFSVYQQSSPVLKQGHEKISHKYSCLAAIFSKFHCLSHTTDSGILQLVVWWSKLFLRDLLATHSAERSIPWDSRPLSDSFSRVHALWLLLSTIIWLLPTPGHHESTHRRLPVVPLLELRSDTVNVVLSLAMNLFLFPRWTAWLKICLGLWYFFCV